ncbi:MAG: hypothetical protein P8129_24200 [Anaerolineae bacterium]
MFKKIVGIVAIVLVGVLVTTLVMSWIAPGEANAAYGGRQGGAPGAGSRGTVSPAPAGSPGAVNPAPAISTIPAGDLSESEAEALSMALQDEYKAWAVYDQVIADFGAARPFTSIQKAEESHIAALVTLFERYDLEVPENEWPGDVPSFDALADACAAGVQAEIDNAALYDELFSMVDNADIIQVFTSLQQASETRHLPAFERCAP